MGLWLDRRNSLIHTDVETNVLELVGSPSFQTSTGEENIESFEETFNLRTSELNCNVYITVGDFPKRSWKIYCWSRRIWKTRHNIVGISDSTWIW